MSDKTPIPPEVLAYGKELHVHILWARFRRFASYMAARYNGPVYLCGSALRTTTYRDVDLRIVIADDEFCGRYGYEHYSHFVYPNQAWIDDMAKYNGEIARDFKVIPDFQVYPASHCIQYHDKPRVLLAAPSNLDHIVKCTAWFYGEDTPT